MRIGAAETERIDARPSGMAVRIGPVSSVVGTAISARQKECWVGRDKMKIGGIFPFCSIRVVLIRLVTPAADSVCPSIAFDGADDQRLPVFSAGGQRLPQRPGFNRIADNRPRAVRFDILNAEGKTPALFKASG